MVQACGGGKWPQGWCGRHMTVTEHLGGMVEMRGVPTYAPCIYKWHAEHARTRQQEKEQGQANYQVSQKGAKPKRWENKIKVVQKIGKRNKKTERETQQEAKYLKDKRQKKSGQKARRTVRNGELWSPLNLHNKRCNIAMSK